MVIKCDFKDQTEMTAESQSLKFGMDRILSEDMSRSKNAQDQQCCLNYVQPPCAGCLASLYRCCRTLTASDAPHFDRNKIHTFDLLKQRQNSLISNEANLNRLNETTSNFMGDVVKKKRSWSRAVFSNLQRKGLEKRFQIQKYITKPDRRQLAATLGLTDAQVKVWFQNRRMKWRHSKELMRQNDAHNNGSQSLLARADSSSSPLTKSDFGGDIDVQTIKD